MGLLAEGGPGLPTAAACQYVLQAGWLTVARLGLGLTPLTHSRLRRLRLVLKSAYPTSRANLLTSRRSFPGAAALAG